LRSGAAVLAASALALVASGPIAAKPAAPVDWSRTVVKTPTGGFQMGNPKAKVKLVEYGSLACPHCRHFDQTGFKPLVQQYVRPGRVSYEFRNFLLNGPDIAVSLLAHCAGPAKFFPMSRAVFDSQPEWFAKIAALTEAQRAELGQMDEQKRVVRIGEIAGFPQIAARFGVTPVRARQCLTDAKGIERLVGITKAAADAGITGTPTFLINGQVTGVSTWEQLEPLLKAAGR
jgi:protein-disulfide isomerase